MPLPLLFHATPGQSGARPELPRETTKHFMPTRSSVLFAVCSQPSLASLRIEIHSFSQSVQLSHQAFTVLVLMVVSAFSAFSIHCPTSPSLRSPGGQDEH